jgi:hypothetical protein
MVERSVMESLFIDRGLGLGWNEYKTGKRKGQGENRMVIIIACVFCQ